MTPTEYESLTEEQIKAYDYFGWPRESDEFEIKEKEQCVC